MPPNAHLTTPIVWLCTGILVVLDTVLVLLARRAVMNDQFQRMRWLLAGAAGTFFFLVWLSVMLWGWDWFYIYIFPSWAHWVLPPLFAIVYALFALGMSWISLKLPANPAVLWCVLGGVEGLFSHLYAIYGLGAASKPPIMQGTDPFAVLVFAIFEKAFYWSLILLACWFLASRILPNSSKLHAQ